ncbi:pollen-specific leucine-rich repeat extensin-like protein 4 [Iris pallida]|uniref:Pollen-specific leucine-rich repeat extensin-like protein 4 n=1 Tax=Iris pallida TaxID=29817 RepID=A0AAX6FFZ9_IRIPA|nr:pollen-specific leucine-rich repeat extensin-like protein 4 [Iris pallida]
MSTALSTAPEPTLAMRAPWLGHRCRNPYPPLELAPRNSSSAVEGHAGAVFPTSRAAFDRSDEPPPSRQSPSAPDRVPPASNHAPPLDAPLRAPPSTPRHESCRHRLSTELRLSEPWRRRCSGRPEPGSARLASPPPASTLTVPSEPRRGEALAASSRKPLRREPPLRPPELAGATPPSRPSHRAEPRPPPGRRVPAIPSPNLVTDNRTILDPTGLSVPPAKDLRQV